MTHHKSQIIKCLERAATYGTYDYSRTFDDFLSLSNACMKEMPRHYASAVADGRLADDTPETKELFGKLHNVYKPQAFEYFSQALAHLIESTEEWGDTIGDVYMEFGHPNQVGCGQYFTPYPIAKLMAAMIGQGIEKEIHERVKQAISKSPAAQAMLFAGMVVTDESDAFEFYLKKLLPLALPYIDPINVCDPACGSGVMFLAFAEDCPRWALDYGIVQFWGMDIDQTCVDMAKLNLMLYGLNGYGIKHVLELQARELNAIPEPYKSTYTEVIQHPEKIEEVKQQVWEYKQAALFDLSG